MTARSEHGAEAAAAPVTCVAEGGCSYLRALAQIEHLAGYEHTAKSYAAAAARCQRDGCWAAAVAKGAPAVPGAAEPIPLHAPTTKLVTPSPAIIRFAETVPFDRSQMIDIVSDGEGNYVERRQLKLESLPRRNDPLGYLYDYWCGLRAQTALQFSNIDTVHLMRAGIIGKLHLVDVSSSNPDDFHFDLYGYAIPGCQLERPRAHPIAIYAETTLRDYNTARVTAAPRLQRVRGRLGDTNHHYTRLILPFLNEHGRVSHLAVAIRQEPGDASKVETRH